MGIITLTTDFGTRDWFVGTLKGVILSVAPNATIVDLMHEIPPGDIRAGAFALAAGFRFFPKGTVHVAVVDPGVGSTRSAIAVRTSRYLFVGPDNGVLSFALAGEKIKSIHRLANEEFFLRPVSRTFHGRDVFAPVAAHLSRGVSIGRLGPQQKEFTQLAWPKPRLERGVANGEILYVDRFGNAITNLDANSLRLSATLEVFAKRRRLCRLEEFYAAVPAGRAVAVVGSSGFLEIAVNGGSAAEKFGLNVGDRITLRRC